MNKIPFACAMIAVAAISGCSVPLPQTESGREYFFTQEEHMILAGKCGWLGDVTVFTGQSPAVMDGSENIMAAEESHYSNDAYFFKI